MATKRPTTKRTPKPATPEQHHAALMQGIRASLGIKAPKGGK